MTVCPREPIKCIGNIDKELPFINCFGWRVFEIVTLLNRLSFKHHGTSP